MKYLNLIIIALLLSSCCSTKKAVQNTQNQTPKPIAEVVKPETNLNNKEQQIEKKNDSIYYIKGHKAITYNDSKNIDSINKKDSIIQIPLPPKLPKPVENLENNTESFNHNRWNTILHKHVSKAGNVNYNTIRKNRTDLDIYIDSLSKNRPTDNWSAAEKLAYWINAYNAFTVDLILRNYPVKSIKDIKDPWKQRLWKLDEKWYNLDEIEHQILRKMDEPRIHFSIVCASFSCPKLQNKAFTSQNLEAQLTKATKDFLSDPNRNNISTNSLKISKIFKWFSKDFKAYGGVSNFINTYTDINISNAAKTSYKDYNWDLND